MKMELSQQVVSLELAKLLKELNVKQDGYLCWFKLKEKDNWALAEYWQIDDTERFDTISAFTVSEIGEMLFPFNIVTYKYKKGKKYVYEVMVQDMEMRISKEYVPSHFANTEADARAFMLVYLLQSKLMELPK